MNLGLTLPLKIIVMDSRKRNIRRPRVKRTKEEGERKPPFRKDNERKPTSFRRNDEDKKPSFRKNDEEGKASYRTNDESRKPSFAKDDRKRAPFRKDDRRKPGSFRRNEDDRKPSFRKNDEERKASYRTNDEGRKPSFAKDDRRRAPFRKDDGRKPVPFRRNEDDRKPSFRKNDEERGASYRTNNEGRKPSYAKDDRKRAPFRKDDRRRPVPFRRSEDDRKPSFRKNDEEGKASFTGDDRRNEPNRKDEEERGPSFAKKRFDDKSRPARNYRSADNRKPVFANKRSTTGDLIRLNRLIATSGICSRREADDMITAGLISVNGKTITLLGTKVSPNDDIRYNGERLKKERLVYILLNKPRDYVTTLRDPYAKRTVMELIKGACKERVYPVGRLDRNTTGVLLLTNDGDMAKKLSHPSYNKKKIYHVFLDHNLKYPDLKSISNGIELDDGFVKVDEISFTDQVDKKQIGVEIHSGKNHIVRRIFEHFDYKVLKLDRVYFAGLTKKGLQRGEWRFLTNQEIGMLKMGGYK
jgi:23S rRNA pseudouridine2605 synthase